MFSTACAGCGADAPPDRIACTQCRDLGAMRGVVSTGLPLPVRIFGRCRVEGACWRYGPKDQAGYGSLVLVAGRQMRAHQAVMHWLFGPLPAGVENAHRCGVRDCCNPAHLERVTKAENLRRRSHRLTDEARRARRAAYMRAYRQRAR